MNEVCVVVFLYFVIGLELAILLTCEEDSVADFITIVIGWPITVIVEIYWWMKGEK